MDGLLILPCFKVALCVSSPLLNYKCFHGVSQCFFFFYPLTFIPFCLAYCIQLSFKIWLSEHGASHKQIHRTHCCNSMHGVTSCLVTLPSSMITFCLAHWVLSLLVSSFLVTSATTQKIHVFFYSLLLLRWDLHTIKSITLKWKIQWHVVHSPCCTTNLSLVPEHFHHPKGNPVPIKQLFPILPSPIS